VNVIVTDLAVIEVVKEGLLLTEIAPDTTLDAVRQATGTALLVAPDLKPMEA
jgi:acyl CoA:acetate/3-ketoacid CoA transferase beta subunit